MFFDNCIRKIIKIQQNMATTGYILLLKQKFQNEKKHGKYRQMFLKYCIYSKFITIIAKNGKIAKSMANFNKCLSV